MYYWSPPTGHWANQTQLILRDKSEMAPEKLFLLLQVQSWLLHQGSGMENNTFRASCSQCFSLPQHPLLPQPQAQRCCGSSVCHNLRNSQQEQFGDAMGPRGKKKKGGGGCFSVFLFRPKAWTISWVWFIPQDYLYTNPGDLNYIKTRQARQVILSQILIFLFISSFFNSAWG